MNSPEHISDSIFNRYSEADFDDPSVVQGLTAAIKRAFAADTETQAKAYERGLHGYAFGPLIDEEYPDRHPQLAVTMFRGIHSTLEAVHEAERDFTFNYELTSAIQVCTAGSVASRNYRLALDLVREFFPLELRTSTQGMNDYEDLYIAYNSLTEDKTAVLPKATDVFSELIELELDAIQAGKELVQMHEIGDEQIVLATDMDTAMEALRAKGATDIITVENKDGTYTQIFGTGTYDYRIPILEYACQARGVPKAFDIVTLVMEHPDFLSLPERAQLKLLNNIKSDARESNQPHIIQEMINTAQKLLPGIGSILQWEIDL